MSHGFSQINTEIISVKICVNQWLIKKENMQEISDVRCPKDMNRNIMLSWDLSGVKRSLWMLGLPMCIMLGASLAAEQYLLVGGLLAILLVFVIFLFPYAGILLFLALTYARPQDYVPGIAGKPIILALMIVTLGCWLVRILIFRQREFVKAPQHFLLLGLLLIAMLSCIQVWLLAAKEALMDFLKIFLAYFLIVSLIDTREKFSVALWVMFAGTVYIAILGIFQHYGLAPGIAGIAPEGGRVQGFGIFDNPNYLAYGVAFMIPFALYNFYYSRFLPVKLFSLLIVFVVFLPCIYFTQSRGGLLCAALTISFSVFQDRKLRISLIGGLISVGIVFILLKTVAILGTVATYQDDDSAMGRVEAWRAGFDMLRTSPLFGVGYQQFREHWKITSHNSFVLVGSELGLIGLFVWIGLLYWSYKYLKAVIQNFGDTKIGWQKAYIKSLKASLLAFTLGSCFAALGYYMLLYLFHSLAVVTGQLYLPEDKRNEINQIRSKDLLTIGVIEVLVLCVWYVFPRL